MKKLLLVLIVLLSACTFQTKHRGYVFPENLEEKIANIKTTTQLQDEIGDPQTRTMYGDEVWIYYGSAKGNRSKRRTRPQSEEH